VASEVIRKLEKLIPFYRKLDKDQVGYTLLMDQQSEKVYKVEHGKTNQYSFWITWALLLAFMRMVKDVPLPMTDLKSFLIVITSMIISGLIGVYKYNNVYKDKREVYYTEYVIREYIHEGKALLKREVYSTVMIFSIFAILMALFVTYGWTVSLVFSLIFLGLFVYAACGLPLARFKLYK